MDSQGKWDRSEFFMNVLSCVFIVLAVVVLVAGQLCRNRFMNVRIVTESMEPSLQTGESYLFCTKFDTKELQRGSVILFENKELGEELYVKRIIGLPGEIVQFEGGRISIDGTYLGKGMSLVDAGYDAIFEVPEGCYFVMGDNFNSSYDSRFWENPYVSLEQIRGILEADDGDKWKEVE